MAKPNPSQQIAKLMQLLHQLPRDKATEDLFLQVCDWILDLPPGKRPQALTSAVAHAFGKTVEQVDERLKQIDRRVEFDGLVPKTGWIRDYVDWTRQTEPPTVFHFFVAATVLGATLGRHISFDKGAYSVFPNLCVMIIAPSGRCRKTSACNLGTKLFNKTGGTFLADKATPEALVDALKDQMHATGLIYAPELAVFLGKQKYQEGMVPLLTSLFDCPDEWTSKTIGRGEVILTGVALSALLCSTIDWIQTAIPSEAFGGGFMSRFLFVIQESTARSFPIPPPLSDDGKKELTKRLSAIKLRRGIFQFSPEAHDWYTYWYRTRPSLSGDKQFAGYFERKPDHLIRLAMIMKIAEMDPTDKNYILDPSMLQRADAILYWLEGWLPAAFEEMTTTISGEDQSRIRRQLKMAGGSMEHSVLLRRNSSKMNAEQFKRCVNTLREAKLIEWDATTRTYFLTAEGWA